jgi:hypothetical protein
LEIKIPQFDGKSCYLLASYLVVRALVESYFFLLIAFRTETMALGKHERPVIVMENRWIEAGK